MKEAATIAARLPGNFKLLQAEKEWVVKPAIAAFDLKHELADAMVSCVVCILHHIANY